jgi:hypothetical protein
MSANAIAKRARRDAAKRDAEIAALLASNVAEEQEQVNVEASEEITLDEVSQVNAMLDEIEDANEEPSATRGQALQRAILAKIDARIASSATDSMRDEWSKERKHIASEHTARMLDACYAKGFESINVLPASLNAELGSVAYIQSKTFTKIRRLISTIAQGINALDGYTYALVVNLANLQKPLDLRNSKATMSRNIVFDEVAYQAGVKTLKTCSKGTASSQVSSTRVALAALGLAVINKGQKNAEIVLTDSDEAQTIVALFRS